MYFMESKLREETVTENPFLITVSHYYPSFILLNERKTENLQIQQNQRSPRKYIVAQLHTGRTTSLKSDWAIGICTKIRTHKNYFRVLQHCHVLVTNHSQDKKAEKDKNTDKKLTKQRVSHPASEGICQDSKKHHFWSCARGTAQSP